MKRLLYLIALILISSCTAETFDPLNANDKTIASPVKNVRVENLPGKAKIDYDFPVKSNVLYVEAEYEHSNGTFINAKSSYYNNTVTLDGFGEAKEYEVKLYSVGRNLIRSEPVIIKVKPTTPPVLSMFQSLVVRADFGGLQLGYNDNDGSPLVVIVERLNSNNEWQNVNNFYTQQVSGTLYARGLPPVETKFRVYTKDKWDNFSEYLETTLTPLYEEEMDYLKFKPYRLPNDARDFPPNFVYFLWNNDVSSNPSGAGGWYRIDNGSGIPNHLTIDMGQTAKLSRIIFHQRGYKSNTPLLYSSGDVKFFEVWGSNNPSADGNFASWVKIETCEITKPSGSPIGTNTSDDINAAVGGREFPMPLEAEPYRYIRIRVIETWGPVDYFWIGELDFFGQIQH